MWNESGYLSGVGAGRGARKTREKEVNMSREALLYHRLECPPDGSLEREQYTVVCDLCHHRCTIRDGKVGRCRVRRNQLGWLESLVYGRCVALTPDPIEKKPFFHFLPGTFSLSLATVGCNFTCKFCQNHHLSQFLRDNQGPVPGEWIMPEQIVETALRQRCRSISFTYTEPTVFFEYALDTARLAHEKKLATCFVSNGFMTPEAVELLAPCLDAINVDLKSFNPEVYRKIIGGELAGVLETIRSLKAHGIWIEVTTLLIEGMNDSPAEVRKIAEFLVGVDPDLPWHVSRFHPQYHMTDHPVTRHESIRQALEIGRQAGLRHIYCGNVSDERSESTWCPECGELLIARSGFSIRKNTLKPGGKCPECGALCAGRWEEEASSQ